MVFNLEPTSGHELIEEIVEVMRPPGRGQADRSQLHPLPGALAIQRRLRPYADGHHEHRVQCGQVHAGKRSSRYFHDRFRGFANLLFKDSGIGINPEDLSHIFDRFYRVKGKATRHITGSGLGLSLVKEVVEAHQGYIDVQSTPGQGTTFILSFPLSEAVAGPNATVAS